MFPAALGRLDVGRARNGRVHDVLASDIELVPIDSIHPHPNNPRRGNVELIRESIRHNGFTAPLLVQLSRRRILAGEHRWRAAQAEDMPEVPVVWLDVDDDHAIRVLLADNKTADDAEYDPGSLAEVLELAAAANAELAGTGWSTVEYEALLNSAQGGRDSFRDDEAEAGDDESTDWEALDGMDKGSLLKLADVTIGEPRTKVHNGEVWKLGPHLLVIEDVAKGWPTWSPLLTGERLFMPYPGVYLLMSRHAVKHEYLMVQPSHYLAGHLLDKWNALYGDDTPAELVEA